MTFTVCDRCKQECTTNTANIRITFNKNGSLCTRNLDLCEHCYVDYGKISEKVDDYRLTLNTNFMNTYE